MKLKTLKFSHEGQVFDYKVIKYHRDSTPGKSQWTITQDMEIDFFKNSIIEIWRDDMRSWCLSFNEIKLQPIGICSSKKEAFIGLFRTDAATNPWHGYPIDHNDASDRPTDEVFRKWVANPKIPQPKLSKLLKRKKCRA